MLHEAFQKLRSNLELNETFGEVISRKHNAVRSVIENNGRSIETKLIGSLQRQTRIQPKEGHDFDVDILVELGGFNQWAPSGGVTPQMAIEQLHSVVQQSDRYSAMNPRQDHPTVSFEYADGVKVELVAAYRDNIGHDPSGMIQTVVGRGYWVPKGGTWELADYDYEADHIAQQNTATAGWLVPTIKMLKAIKRDYFPGMSSFHLEILAANVLPAAVSFRKVQNMPVGFPFLITDFFNLAGNHLSTPLRMPGSNSPHVQLDAAAQLSVPGMVETIKNYCNSINNMGTDQQKLNAWKEIFKDSLPLT